MLLIDDVMITGATLYKAAKTPHRAGSGPVRGLVLARRLRHGL
jgi:predicted amidophosphoribosyltransferase